MEVERGRGEGCMEGRGRKEEKEDQSGFTVSCYVLFYDAQKKAKKRIWLGVVFFLGGGYQY